MIFSGFWVVFWQQYISLPIYVRTYVDPNANIDRLLAVEADDGHPAARSSSTTRRGRCPPFAAIIAGVLISSLSWLFLTLGSGVALHRRRAHRARHRRGGAGAALLRVHLAAGAPGQQGLFMGYAFLPIGIGYLIAGPTAGWLLHYFGEVRKQPHQMWYVIAAAGVVTTLLLIATTGSSGRRRSVRLEHECASAPGRASASHVADPSTMRRLAVAATGASGTGRRSRRTSPSASLRAAADGRRRAVLQVVAEELAGHAPERFLHRGQLHEDVGAVAVLVDHPLQPAHLPLDAAQAHEVALLDGRVHRPRPGLAERGVPAIRVRRRTARPVPPSP